MSTSRVAEPNRSERNGHAPSRGQPIRRQTKPINWDRFFATMKYWIVSLVTKVGLGIIYMSVIREGLAYMVPFLGQRLSKLPGLTFLADFEATYRLDLAIVFSLFLLCFVWWLWSKLLL